MTKALKCHSRLYRATLDDHKCISNLFFYLNKVKKNPSDNASNTIKSLHYELSGDL